MNLVFWAHIQKKPYIAVAETPHHGIIQVPYLARATAKTLTNPKRTKLKGTRPEGT